MIIIGESIILLETEKKFRKPTLLPVCKCFFKQQSKNILIQNETYLSL